MDPYRTALTGLVHKLNFRDQCVRADLEPRFTFLSQRGGKERPVGRVPVKVAVLADIEYPCTSRGEVGRVQIGVALDPGLTECGVDTASVRHPYQ